MSQPSYLRTNSVVHSGADSVVPTTEFFQLSPVGFPIDPKAWAFPKRAPNDIWATSWAHAKGLSHPLFPTSPHGSTLARHDGGVTLSSCIGPVGARLGTFPCGHWVYTSHRRGRT